MSPAPSSDPSSPRAGQRARGRPRGAKEPKRPRSQAAGRLEPRPLSPPGSAAIPAVTVKSLAWHPLVYRKRIAQVDSTARAGDLVAVYDAGRQLLGYGLYNPRSEIALRMLRFGPQYPDDSFWHERLAQAVALRRDLLRLDDVTDAYRLIHAEGDGLSGLVVDRYGETLSAEIFTVGMYQRAAALLERLAALCGTKHTLIRPSPYSESQEGFQAEPVASPESPRRVTVREFGTRFRIDFEGGHKTGFFCDQRDNRRRLAEFCAGRSVLDPPKLIRNRAELDEGIRKHFDLNRLAMQLVRPGGLLLSCSCAGLLGEAEFLRLLTSAARQAGPIPTDDPAARPTPRPLQILAKTGAAADHPVAANCPESEYLKAVWMRLE